MKLIISHPTSNEVNKAAVYGLLESKLLCEFNTSIASFPGTLMDYISNAKHFTEIRRRNFKAELQPYTNTFPLLEAGRQMALKFGFSKLVRHEKGIFCLDAVYQHMDKQLASRLKQGYKNDAKGIFAYEDSALFSFKEAKRLGLQCFYDAQIGYWRAARRLMVKEIEQWPEWYPTLVSFTDSEAKSARKDEELRLADLVFVARSFTAATFKEFPGLLAPVKTIPYGFPPVIKQREYNRLTGYRPLKLLFVGGLTQRKGIANLFSAVQAVGRHIELTIIGNKPINSCTALNKELAKHRWIPSLIHLEVLRQMREHDVLVFPSLFEGFGLVITTNRTAGPDLIEHGKNGWLVEAGSVASLQAAIEDILVNPKVIEEVGKQAIQAAIERPWDVYKSEITHAIKEHFEVY